MEQIKHGFVLGCKIIWRCKRDDHLELDVRVGNELNICLTEHREQAILSVPVVEFLVLGDSYPFAWPSWRIFQTWLCAAYLGDHGDVGDEDE